MYYGPVLTKQPSRSLAVMRLLAFGLAISGLARLSAAVLTSWGSYGGELMGAFPGYTSQLVWLNPTVYAQAPIPWFGPNQWFYGPFHHLAHLPLVMISPSLAWFWHALQAIQIIMIIVGVAALSRIEPSLPSNHRLLFFVLAIGLTFSQFAVLENLRMRNSELLEFVLLLGALWSLYRGLEATSGGLLALAGLVKLLPVVFFFLLLTGRFLRGMIGYVVTTLTVVVLATFLLGWENYALFNPEVARSHGLPTLSRLLGEEPFQPNPISETRGSFYTFLLVPYYTIEFPASGTEPVTSVVRPTTSTFLVPNVAFMGVVLFVFVMTIVGLRKAGADWLFGFGLLGCLMLVASPRTNPHYYVFPLFGFFWFARRFVGRAADGLIGRSDVTLAIALGCLMLAYDFVVPLSIVDRLSGLAPATSMRMLAVYGIQGVATLVLWTLLIYTRLRIDRTISPCA